MFPCITKDKSALNKDIFTVGFCLFVFTDFLAENFTYFVSFDVKAINSTQKF